MISLTLRNCVIVAGLVVSATGTVEINSNSNVNVEDAHFEFDQRNLLRNLRTGRNPRTGEELSVVPVDGGGNSTTRATQTTRIVGGTEAPQGKYPYFVQWARGCGASLIHSDILLTAAHCDGTNIPTSVVVGAYRNGQATLGGQARQVVERSRHPKYSSFTDMNDFMVMRINSPVTGVTPVALNSNAQVPATGDTLTVIGFGDLKNGAGSYPTFLQEVNVPFVPHTKCNQLYGGRIDSTSMLCAGFDQGGKDSCQGDSGGPLLKIVNGVHTQVGVVSWGNGCALAGSPGVYSRVSGQLTWIQSEVCRLTKTNPKPSYCTGTTGTGGTGTGTTGTGGTGGTGSTGCVDSPTATFFVSYSQGIKNCAWLATRPNFQARFCGWDSYPDYYCQKTCKSCNYWNLFRSKDSMVTTCDDSINEFWVNAKVGFKTCSWLATKEKWQEKLCGGEHQAYFECQTTCNSCEYWQGVH